MAWISMGKACRTLGVCRHTMRRYCLEGLVEAERLPSPIPGKGHWRIDEDSLQALLGGTTAKALAILEEAGICASK